MNRATSLILACVLAAAFNFLVLPASPASAHMELKSSSPANGATVTSPKSVDLFFTGGIQKNLAEVAVTHDTTGTRVDSGKPTVIGNLELSVALASVKAGPYTVNWSVLAEDGHRITGTFKFTAEVPATTTTTAAAPATTTAAPAALDQADTGQAEPVQAERASASTESSDNRGLLLAAAVIVGVISLVVAFLALRPRY